MKIAIVTAGGAGMFCGSCMHDNTWARGLRAAGHDVTLLPLYTPIRVDEDDQSTRRVFLGGINIYMDSKSRVWRGIPRVLTRWLDSRWVMKLVSKLAISNDAKHLGQLTIATLQGDAGPQVREVRELAAYLGDELRPDVICFSNAMLAGAAAAVRKRFTGKMYCLLQGDDIFLQDLPEPYRTQAIELMHAHSSGFDGLIVHSRFYRDFMSELLSIPAERFSQLPLGIDFTGHDGAPARPASQPFTIGFFARICPEKGLQNSLAAFRLFHGEHPASRFIAGGYLGVRDRAFFREQMRSIGDLGDAVRYLGSPDSLAGKAEFYQSCDLFSVPTTYREPKGLPVLESLANGTPVVQPNHGAFPEMLGRTGGGVLVPPTDPAALAAAWGELFRDGARREELSRAGHAGVREHYSISRMVAASEALFSHE